MQNMQSSRLRMGTTHRTGIRRAASRRVIARPPRSNPIRSGETVAAHPEPAQGQRVVAERLRLARYFVDLVT